MAALQPTRRKVLGGWRRWFFYGWVGLTLLAIGFIAVMDPFALGGGVDKATVAVFVPPLMIVLTVIGLGWLLLLVLSVRRDGKDKGSS